MNERDLFMAAVQIGDAAERAAYLDRACTGETALRQRVEALLAAFAQAGSFLQQPAGEPRATSDVSPPGPSGGSDPAEGPGTVIGPYKLVEQIGEGGMGTVWMAQQTEPVRRLVAVKLIKAGMDSRQVIARFEAERQALALMDHAHIARVLDAGTTGAGRPFFVMDLVKGVPITRYCDEHRLTPRQRLELFVPVCQAVQHAHQKGIIHRDLKPSNVLVALYDGQPVPKVIDFGVAKAAGQMLTDKTLVTGFGAIVGTLEYMSPEQAEVNQLDIDTRSDIYSLGVLLYELLTGTTPLERKRVKESGMLEALRIIREEEVPTLSNRLSTAEELPTIAANRGLEPARLTRLLRGELDWIVMKALEKDRIRRYETANSFALDVQRYLADEPVLACPPSAGYRLGKFARRNKGGLAVAALVLCFLVFLGSGVGWAVRDRVARQGRTGAQVDLILGEVEQLKREQKWPEALMVARRAEAAVTGGEADAATAQRVRALLRDLAFIDRLEQIRMMSATSVGGKYNDAGDREYARAFRDYGVDVEASAAEASIEHLKARPGLAIPTAAALDDWVFARWLVSESDAGGWKRLVAVARGIDPEPLRDRLRTTWGQPVTPEARDELRRLADAIDVRAHHPATLVSLARTLEHAKHADSAMRLLRDARSAYPGDFWLNYELGYVLYEHRDHEGAIRFYTAAVSVRPSSAPAHNRLGLALRARKKLDEALACFGTASELDRKNATYHINLGYTLGLQGRMDEAIAAYEEALRLHPDRAYAHHAFGCFLRDIKHDDAGAIACFDKAIGLDPNNVLVHNDLAWLLATGSDAKLRDPGRAVALAQKAVELAPNAPEFPSTLGVAHYRAAGWKAAIVALETSMAMRKGGDSNEWFFLAMAHWRLGEKDKARAWYDQAVQWMDKNQPTNEELRCFRAEAAELLGVNDKKD
jgi:serine/threonine protein kinase/tetratricopeptide (TPR) repeat protein